MDESQESVSSQDSELAAAYSEYLIDSEDESGDVLKALRSSLQESREHGKAALGVGGAQSGAPVKRPVVEPVTGQQGSRRARFKRSCFGSRASLPLWQRRACTRGKNKGTTYHLLGYGPCSRFVRRKKVLLLFHKGLQRSAKIRR